MDSLFKDEINGDFILLKKIALSDANEIYTWRKSHSGRFLRNPDNYNLTSQLEWIRSRNNDEINYIIYDKKLSLKVGMIGIYDVDLNDKVANVGRLLLSELFLRKSNPYGLEALLLTYGYVFNEMNFRKITGIISSSNAEMVKLQKFLGMHEEGYLKKHTVISNEIHDLHIMSLFQEGYIGYSNKIKFLLKSFKKSVKN